MEGEIMDYLKNLVTDNGLIFVLIPLICSLLARFINNSQGRYHKVTGERIIKMSIMEDIFMRRVEVIMIQMLVFIILFVIFGSVSIYLLSIGKINDFDPSNIYIVIALTSFLLSEFIPKIHNNRKAFTNNLLKSRKITMVKNFLLFYAQSNVIIITLIITGKYNVPSTFVNTIIFLVIWAGTVMSCLLYFSAAVKGNRYSHINIYFNNAYQVNECPYQNMKMDDQTFVTVRDIDSGQITKYNKNTIVKMDFLKNTLIENEFENKLLKRGFVK